MELSDLVHKIGEKLDDEEIAAIVTKLKERGYFDRNLPKTSGVDLLSAMTSQQMITTSDLSLLEKILYVLERKELIDYLREFKIQQEHGVLEEPTAGSMRSVTFLFKNFNTSRQLLRGLMNHLSEILSIPREHVSIRHVASVSNEGTVTVMMKPVYIEILEDMLQTDSQATGLHAFGVTDVQTRTNADVSFHIDEVLVPAKQLHDYKKLVATLEQKNAVVVNKLETLSKNIDSAVHMIIEAGDINTYMKRVKRLHQISGMSTTIWKTLGKMKDGQLPEYYTPLMMQDEIRQACLYSKGRLSRLYPGRKWDVPIGIKVVQE